LQRGKARGGNKGGQDGGFEGEARGRIGRWRERGLGEGRVVGYLSVRGIPRTGVEEEESRREKALLNRFTNLMARCLLFGNLGRVEPGSYFFPPSLVEGGRGREREIEGEIKS
jgi:hypothetical protein